jgi:hypothetical protein
MLLYFECVLIVIHRVESPVNCVENAIVLGPNFCLLGGLYRTLEALG